MPVFIQAALENAAWVSGRDGGHGVGLMERGLEFHVVATNAAAWYGIACMQQEKREWGDNWKSVWDEGKAMWA